MTINALIGHGSEISGGHGASEQKYHDLLDALIRQEMERTHVPGAAVSLVKDGRVLLMQGYGHAELSGEMRVDPERTIFRVASISKLVTATAVMQAYERGLVGFDVDVNEYLTRLSVPGDLGRPVTLSHLLTHTSGLDVIRYGHAVRNRTDKLSLGEFIIKALPPVVHRPGTIFTYNNYGYALAGYVVQRVFGMPFSEVAQERIFEPLGMNSTQFGIPDETESMAVGYRYEEGQFVPVTPDYLNAAPAAGLTTTAADMARFMMAHLNHGRLGDARILQESTARLMQERHFSHHEWMRGWCYGFEEAFIGGRRVLRHVGEWKGFNSILFLVPSEQLGIFIAYNRRDGAEMGKRITAEFLGRSFRPKERPRLTPADQVEELAEIDLEKYEGVYELTRRAKSTFSLSAAEQVVVKARSDKLWINGTAFRRVQGELFSAVTSGAENGRSKDKALFRMNGGEPVFLMMGPRSFERLAWYESPRERTQWGGLLLLTFGSVVIWPLQTLFRKDLASATPNLPVRFAMWAAPWMALLAIGLCLAFWVGHVTVLLEMKPFDVFYGVPQSMERLLKLRPAIMGATVAVGMICLLAWKDGLWTRARRIHYTAITLALVVSFLDMAARGFF